MRNIADLLVRSFIQSEPHFRHRQTVYFLTNNIDFSPLADVLVIILIFPSKHIGAGTESYWGEMPAVAGTGATMGVTESVVTSEMGFKSCRTTSWFGLDELYMHFVHSLGQVIRIRMLLW